MNVLTATDGLDLPTYAAEKRLPDVWLLQLGVRTFHEAGKPTCIAIPYRDAEGNVVFTKYRGSGDVRFWSDKGATPTLYGLDRLANADPERAVLVVEGESDAQTLWHHDMLAVGVPGATAWRTEWAEHLAGRAVYVWQEPGDAGETSVRRIAGDLQPVRAIRAPEDAKDPSELHVADPATFRARMGALVARAVDVSVPTPRGARRRRRHRRGCRCRRCLFRPAENGDRPPRRTVEAARRRSILEVARRLGLGDPRRRGSEYVVCCPFHEDTRPSLRLHPKKGTWYCDPCAEGGDHISLWMQVRGVDFPSAVRELVR